ncbi:PLP-dependent aminotransferase family protein, partial [Klebsiella pneumoniae]|nr:PLP-dependent aminotransferase family protein [Klebsiella pneumoniae]
FLPNVPLVQQIRTETQKDDLINLASGELSPELIPSDRFLTILSEKTFMVNLGYDHPLGNEMLRTTIAAHVQQYIQIEADSCSILITSG